MFFAFVISLAVDPFVKSPANNITSTSEENNALVILRSLIFIYCACRSLKSATLICFGPVPKETRETLS